MLHFPTIQVSSVQEYLEPILPQVQETFDIPVTKNGVSSALFYAWGSTPEDIRPLLKFSGTLSEMLDSRNLPRVTPRNPGKDGGYLIDRVSLSTPYCVVSGLAGDTRGAVEPFCVVMPTNYYAEVVKSLTDGVPSSIILDPPWVTQNYFLDGCYCGPATIPCSILLNDPRQQSLDGLKSVRGRLHLAPGNAISSARDLTYVKELDIEYAPRLVYWPENLTGACKYIRLGECPCIPPREVLASSNNVDISSVSDTIEEIDDWLHAERPWETYLEEMHKYRDLNLALCLIPMTEHPLTGVRALINARLQGLLL